MRSLRCLLGVHDFVSIGEGRIRCRRCGLREHYAGMYFDLDICDSGWRELWVPDRGDQARAASSDGEQETNTK